jgi:peptidoglycan/LPS O-acetylase OafA/YrhL
MISRMADCGRILGATAVFYFHVGLQTGYPLSRWGEYAVAMFILLSGVAYTGFSSLRPTDGPSYARYVAARIKAILPVWIAINGAIYLASFCYPSALGRPFTFPEFLLSCAGLSQYFGHRYLSTVMWFVPFILQAYFLFPLLDPVLDRVPAALMIVLAYALSLPLMALVYEYWPLYATEICRNWSVLFRLPEVCLGVALGRGIFRRCRPREAVAALAAFAAVSLALATVCSNHFPAQAYVLSLPWNGLVVTAVITVAALLVAAAGGSRLNPGLLRLLGAASFPFFLAHGAGIRFIHCHSASGAAGWPVYFLLCWALAVVITVLTRRRKAKRAGPI